MEEKKKGEIKAIYSELRGYLAQAPEIKDMDDIDDESVWEQYNRTVDSLSKVSNEDYSHFRIEPKSYDSTGRSYVNLVTYRQKLGGLISRLHGEYFEGEPNPLDGVPSTVITQSQQQVQIAQMIIDITDIIHEKIDKYEEGSNKKSFLQKLKDSLSSISNVKQLLQTIFKLAKEYGLNMNEAFEIFTKTQ